MSTPDAGSSSQRRRVALFDLDHTLIPFDSGMAWSRHLVQLGHLPADIEDQHLAYARQYVQGCLNFHELHQCLMGPFKGVPVARIRTWRDSFAAGLPARMPAAARALLQGHVRAGDLCSIVTATSRFVSEPFAQALGAPNLIATEACVGEDGCFSGAIDGVPCFREGKIEHVTRWLAAQGLRWEDLERSTFYSDSINDLALLEHVTHPVVVTPDNLLREHALQRGWVVVESLEEALQRMPVAVAPG